MKKLLLAIIAISAMNLTPKKAAAQENQGDLVVTGGVGYSLAMGLFKGVINTALTSSNLKKATATPIINGMVDYAITDKFSLGGAYSYNNFVWQDSYNSVTYQYDSTTGAVIDSSVTTQSGKVKLTRQNFGVRPLFHFGNGADFDMYAGARVGFSYWNASYEVQQDGQTSASGISPKGSVFTVQALFGIRKYFNEHVGLNFEFGIGNSPYFLAGGLNFRI